MNANKSTLSWMLCLPGVSSLTVRVEGGDKQRVNPWAFIYWTKMTGLHLTVDLLWNICTKESPWWLLKILFLVFQAYLMMNSNSLRFLWIYFPPCSIQHSVLKAKSLEEELEEAKNNLNLLEEKRQQILWQNKQLVGALISWLTLYSISYCKNQQYEHLFASRYWKFLRVFWNVTY